MRSTTPIEIEIGRSDEYNRLKRLLNRGSHPAFIGRDLVGRCALNGGLIFFRSDNTDAAVALVNTRRNILLVLNVLPEMRGRGVGEVAVRYLKPSFIRAIDTAVPYFERLGYQVIGQPKRGITLTTRVMVRRSLIEIAGRLRTRLHQQAETESMQDHL